MYGEWMLALAPTTFHTVFRCLKSDFNCLASFLQTRTFLTFTPSFILYPLNRVYIDVDHGDHFARSASTNKV
jgi:hypothetical protein